MTLSELIPLIEAADLGAVQKRDQISALRAVARVLKTDLSEIEAHPAKLRRRLEGVAPEAIGMSKGRWANIRSLLSRALEHGRVMMPGRRTVPVSPSWQALLERVGDNRRIRLAALARHLTMAGVEPEQVTVEILDEYRRAIQEDRLRKAPEKTWDMLVCSWNACIRDVPGWPPVVIPREDRREIYVLPWADFSEDLQADVRAFLRRQSGADLSEDGPPRPLRVSSLKTREYQLRLAASALVLRGVPAGQITSIADLLTLNRFKEILSFLLERRGGTTSVQVGQLAGFLKGVAEHWVKADDLTLLKMKRLASRLSVETHGMTRKNRERLRPLDDPAMVQRFVRLPDTIRAAVEADRRPPRLKAIAAQCAAAIAILQVAPIRIGNLASLDLRRHLIERAGQVYLVIPPEEVKNREPVDVELPASTIEVLSWYLVNFRPHLVRARTTAVFPGEGNGPKAANTLSIQLSREVFRHTGLQFHAHLFRHAAGKVYLDQRPGEYEVVRRFLGHRSIATTTSIYTGAETRSASRQFVAVVEGLRKGTGTIEADGKVSPRSRAGRGRR